MLSFSSFLNEQKKMPFKTAFKKIDTILKKYKFKLEQSYPDYLSWSNPLDATIFFKVDSDIDMIYLSFGNESSLTQVPVANEDFINIINDLKKVFGKCIDINTFDRTVDFNCIDTSIDD